MYYNRILRVWMVDPLDYFLLSAIIGSLVASRLKAYLSEKKAMERLKNSIINKSKLVTKTHQKNGQVLEIFLKYKYKKLIVLSIVVFQNY